MRPLAGYSKLFESRPFELMLNCTPDEAIAIMRAAMVRWYDYGLWGQISLPPAKLRDQGKLVRGTLAPIRGHHFAFKTLEPDDYPRAPPGGPYCIGTIVQKGSSTAVVGSIRYPMSVRALVIELWFFNTILLTAGIFTQSLLIAIPALVPFGIGGLFIPWRLRVLAGQWDQLAEDLQRMYSGVIFKE